MRQLLPSCALLALLVYAPTCVAQSAADTDKRQLAAKLNMLLRGHVNATEFEATLFDQISKQLPKPDNTESLEYKNKISTFRAVIRDQLEIYLRESNSLRIDHFENSFEITEIENLVKFFESSVGQKYRLVDQEASRVIARQSEALTTKMSRNIDLKSKEIFGK